MTRASGESNTSFDKPKNWQTESHALECILANCDLNAVFHPIISVHEHQIFGYEALIRGPRESILFSPAQLFTAAENEDRLAELETCCRQICIRDAAQKKLDGYLFLNLLPQFIAENRFPHHDILKWVSEHGLKPQNIVLEITEHHPVSDYDAMRQAIGQYREMGFNIALDDLGAGFAGLRQWSELRPDFVKIDRHFVNNVHIDAAKRQFIHSICEISHILGCKVIAEGIEQEEEYEVIRSLGAHYVQGFLFAKPENNPIRTLKHVRLNPLPLRYYAGRQSSQDVGSLVREHVSVYPELTVHEVAYLLQEDEKIRFLPVIDNGKPIGMIRRSELLTLYSSLYGRDLHGRKPIREFMYTGPLIVSSETLVEQLSQRLTHNAEILSEDDFIVVNEKGYYLGTGTLADLLRVITELQVRNARYANPLTQMPGNVPTSEHMDELLSHQLEFVVVYADLDFFKPFNDVYGYARGDDAIRGLARILGEHIDPKLDFIGHVGGDDFILIFRSKNWQQRCTSILKKFEQFAYRLYDNQHLSDGGIKSCDRQGKPSFYPLLSVSLAAVTVSPQQYFSHHEISAVASDVKTQAKQIMGNSIFINRRNSDSI